MKNDIISIDVSQDYIHHIDRLLERSKLEIFEWFEKPSKTHRVKTYIYKDIDSLRTGLKRRIGKETYKCFPVFYPVGNGRFNIDKSIEDIKYIIKTYIKEN